MNLEGWLASGPYAGAGFREEFRAAESCDPPVPLTLVQYLGSPPPPCVVQPSHNEFIVVTAPSGLVLTATYTGCACYEPWHDAEPADLRVAGTFEELLAQLTEWNDTGEFQVLDDAQVADAREALAALKLFE